ncbi:myosin light chain kinase, smooth muscle-like [Mya arenaria]|uniref:myosin light chain kinase, smooth muscle-like n=1 Tax=Mya arenaria TaxID=6604 RepID=UPI0022DF7726|nr:myosin light chain kinase, smooth muscle-like [Mya arenaria]XP_052814254.1 myosin light chain kinase, smooth muscle-like [Mya arenaria]
MSSITIVPPESPVTEYSGNAAQSTIGPMDAECFVDVRAGRENFQLAKYAGRLPKAVLEMRQQHYKLKQQQLQTAHSPQLPDPSSTLQHQPALKNPAWSQDKVTTSYQFKAFNAEGLILKESQKPVDEGFDSLKIKASATKPLEDDAQPSDTIQEGKVQLCSKKGCEAFLLDIDKLRGTTGVLLNDHFKPKGDRYEVGTHYNKVDRLGAGFFGTVDRCVDKRTQLKFVMKKLKKTTFNRKEVLVPAMFPHNNMTHMFGIISYPDSIELLIEDAGTSLNRFVNKHRDLCKSDKQMWDLVRQGLRALAHLEKYGITHLDIKPENMCILTQEDGSLVLKLTDFGSACTLRESLNFVGMTPEYLAPEIAKVALQRKFKVLNFGVSEGDVTCKVDVFSFGLVIMYIYKGCHILQKLIPQGQTSYKNFPREQQHLLQILMQLANEDTCTFIKNLIPDECSLDMRGLISDLVQHDHQRRPAASVVLQRLEQVVKPESAKQEEGLSPLQVNSAAKYFQKAGKTLTGKGLKWQGKGKGMSRGSTVARQSPYRERPVASKVMNNSLTPVEEMRTLCIEEQPVQGVTDSHAPVAQASMETECTNDCEFIDDNAPMANIQACLIPQFHQTSPFPQTVQAYTQASNVQDVDLRRPVSSSQTVQSLRPQTLQAMRQAASRTTRLFTELDVFGKLLDLPAKSQLQEMTPESPPNPQPTAMNQDCPQARLPCFDMLFS